MKYFTKSIPLMEMVPDINLADAFFTLHCHNGDSSLIGATCQTTFDVLQNMDEVNLDRVPILICILLALTFFLSFPAWAESTTITVKWQQQLLSIDADNIPLNHILAEVSHQTGLEFKNGESLEEPTTLHLTNLNLREGLQKLLSHLNYFIIENSTPQKETTRITVVILGQLETQSDSIESTKARESFSKGSPDEISETSDPNTRLTTLQQVVTDPNSNKNIQDDFYKAANDPDPSIRELAYQQLQAQGDSNLENILLDAAKSPDNDIRRTAIPFIAHSSTPYALELMRNATEDSHIDVRYTSFQELSSAGGEAGLNIIRERLTHPNPEIRIMALETMVAKGPTFALEAARLMLNDDDETIRSKAEEVISELNSH